MLILMSKTYRVYTLLVKGMAALHACKARVLHEHYTQYSHSVHAFYTQMHENVRNYTYILFQENLTG